jgi:hypothetical protein
LKSWLQGQEPAIPADFGPDFEVSFQAIGAQNQATWKFSLTGRWERDRTEEGTFRSELAGTAASKQSGVAAEEYRVTGHVKIKMAGLGLGPLHVPAYCQRSTGELQFSDYAITVNHQLQPLDHLWPLELRGEIVSANSGHHSIGLYFTPPELAQAWLSLQFT